ncbi:hypothetical protein EC973_004690 [Apophysomyces ossiformis]|uniref:Protein BZZ1 n=1 Tax=Apophysomyces ossiformis TaxID=679940 RepID=A0A8H7BEF1_9FUNG|nr:hypothetical protein EC973_004690 [Apophysomyces ossiformis]
MENLAKKYKTNAKGSSNETTGNDGEWSETGSTSWAAWSSLVTHTESIARTRYQLADELSNSVAEALKSAAHRKEEARKKHVVFYQKLKSERDKTYLEKDKAKQTYDDRCAATENIKAKLSKGTGDQEKVIDALLMRFLNLKNCIYASIKNSLNNPYLNATIARSNNALLSVPERVYFIPGYIQCRKDKQLQELDSTCILVQQDILLKYIDIEVRTLVSIQRHYERAAESVKRIDPAVDASVFTRQSLETSTPSEPLTNVQFTFLPWNGGANAGDIVIDRDGTLVVNDSAVIFLNNKLVKDRKLLDALGDELSQRSSEIARLEAAVESASKSSPEYDTLKERLLNVTRHITLLSTQKVRVKSEVDVIIQSIGDEGLRAQTHDFKSSSFTMPTTCDYCGNTIWGLSNKGLTSCGFNCHAKCEMKVALNCSRTKGKINRQPSSSFSLSSSSKRISKTPEKNGAISSVSSLVDTQAYTAQETVEQSPAGRSSAVALYDYQAQNEEELTMMEGSRLTVVEPDDGSGWVKAENHNGQVGLVPANYLEMDTHAPVAQPSFTETQNILSPAEAVPQDNNYSQPCEYATVLYDFEAVNSDELNIREGDKVIVTKKDDSGWWEGVLNGKTGIFPANYVSCDQ